MAWLSLLTVFSLLLSLPALNYSDVAGYILCNVSTFPPAVYEGVPIFPQPSRRLSSLL